MFELEQVEDAMRANKVNLAAVSVAVVRRHIALQEQHGEEGNPYSPNHQLAPAAAPANPHEAPKVEGDPFANTTAEGTQKEGDVEMQDRAETPGAMDEFRPVDEKPSLPINFIDIVTNQPGTKPSDTEGGVEKYYEANELENLVVQALCEWLRTPYKSTDPYFMA
eukprot:PhF_6_TR14226/c0_g1_i1/m.22813